MDVTETELLNLYRLNLKISYKGRETEEKLENVGAIASAFVTGFLP
ncbi:hypothetical protein SAMN05518670_3093 [Paenibacillus sp. OK076]|nr:hypothetical protein SAMN05518670_3093 [Paenibacillus sp. OK076]